MELKKMDDVLFEIRNIKNIERIDFSNVMISTLSTIIPRFYVSYDNGKFLMLDSTDKYFPEFIRKLTQVYNDEKNNILETSITDPFRMLKGVHGIKINDEAKSVLESGKLLEINELYSFYDKKESYDESMFFTSDEALSHLNIVLYHLSKFMKAFDIDLKILGQMRGYNHFYAFDGELNGSRNEFSCLYNKIDNNTYMYQFGGLFNDNSTVDVVVQYKKNGISVKTSIENGYVNETSDYMAINGVVRETHELRGKNGIINYDNKDLEPTEMPYKNIVEFDGNKDFDWFSLPWNAYMGASVKINNVSEEEIVSDIHHAYVDILDDGFISREIYSKTYRHYTVDGFNPVEIVLDACNKQTICINVDGIYEIESAFYSGGQSSGYYKTSLEDKYFYHASNAKSIDEIDGSKLILLNKDGGFYKKSDLASKVRLLKVMRGE